MNLKNLWPRRRSRTERLLTIRDEIIKADLKRLRNEIESLKAKMEKSIQDMVLGIMEGHRSQIQSDIGIVKSIAQDRIDEILDRVINEVVESTSFSDSVQNIVSEMGFLDFDDARNVAREEAEELINGLTICR